MEKRSDSPRDKGMITENPNFTGRIRSLSLDKSEGYSSGDQPVSPSNRAAVQGPFGTRESHLDGETDTLIADRAKIPENEIQIIKNQSRDIDFLIRKQTLDWKNSERGDLDEYCEKQRKILDENERAILEENYKAAKKEILDGRQDLVMQRVEKRNPAVKQEHDQSMQKLEREINGYKYNISSHDTKKGDMHVLARNYNRNASQEELLIRLRGEVNGELEVIMQQKRYIASLESEQSKLAEKAQWRQLLQQAQTKELHELVQNIAKGPQIVEKSFFQKLQQIAKQPLEKLDLKELRSSLEQYKEVVEDAYKKVEEAKKAEKDKLADDAARLRKGKGLAALSQASSSK